MNKQGRRTSTNLLRSSRKTANRYRLPDRTKIIGRDEEKSYIAKFLTAIRQGKDPEQNVIIFQGPSGCGASLMTSFTCNMAEREECCDVTVSTVVQGYKEVPCAAWRPIMTELLLLDGVLGKTIADFERHVCELFAAQPLLRDVPVERMHFLNYFVPVNFDEDGGKMDTLLARREAIAQLCLTIVEWSCQSSGLLLVFDNVQWLDCTSWFALTRVLKSGTKGLACMLTIAEGRNADALDTIRASISVKTFHLGNFREAETEMQLCNIFSAQRVDDELRNHVLERTNGNPLFIKTVASSLKAEGHVHVKENVLTIKVERRDVAMTIHRSLVSLTSLEASYLDPGSQQTILICSLFSGFITARVVADVLSTSQDILKPGEDKSSSKVKRDTVEQHLARLTDAGFLFFAGYSAMRQKEYVLAHQAIRQAFATKLSPKQIKRVHENIAAAMVKRSSTQAGTIKIYAIAGSHWLKAERTLKALELWRKAVGVAEETGCIDEAVVLLERIFSLLKDNESLLQQFGKTQLANLHIKMAMLLTEQGMPETSYPHFFAGCVDLGLYVPTSSYLLTAKNFLTLRSYGPTTVPGLGCCCAPPQLPDLTREQMQSAEVEAFQAKVNAKLGPLCAFANVSLQLEMEYVQRATDILLQCCVLGERSGVPTLALARCYGYLGIATSGVGAVSYLSPIFIERAESLVAQLNIDDDFLLSGLLAAHLMNQGELERSRKYQVLASNNSWKACDLQKYSLSVRFNAALSFMDGKTSLLESDLRRAGAAHFTSIDILNVAHGAMLMYVVEGDSNAVFKLIEDWNNVLRSRAVIGYGKDPGESKWRFNTEHAYMLMVLGRFREGYEELTRYPRSRYRGFTAMHSIGFVMQCYCDLEVALLPEQKRAAIGIDGEAVKAIFAENADRMVRLSRRLPVLAPIAQFLAAAKAYLEGNVDRGDVLAERALVTARKLRCRTAELNTLLLISRMSKGKSEMYINHAVQILKSEKMTKSVFASLIRRDFPDAYANVSLRPSDTER